MAFGRREEIEFSTANERSKVIFWLKSVDDELTKAFGKFTTWDTVWSCFSPPYPQATCTIIGTIHTMKNIRLKQRFTNCWNG